MYYSLTFSYGAPTVQNGVISMPDPHNTWDSWHLIPSSRPVIASPEVVTNFVEIPGRNGALDLSTYLTGKETYKSRTGSLQFYVDNYHENWATIHDKIINWMHGKELYMIMEDIPTWYYHGRFTFNEWKSESWNSSVVLNYTLDPYRYPVYTANSQWLWDPFNFELDAVDNGNMRTGRL